MTAPRTRTRPRPRPRPRDQGRTRTLVVVGNGMAGHRLVRELRTWDLAGAWRVVVLAEEPHPAYDRVALSSYVDGRSAAALALSGPEPYADPLVELRLGSTVAALDRHSRTVRCADGTETGYDALVLATGSYPFVPPVPGRELPGCFTYRTLDDVDAIRAAAAGATASGVRDGVVIGGGLLGLEAVNALRLLGLRPHVVERAPRLMPLQVDDGGGRVLARLVADLGVRVHCGAVVASVDAGPDGRVSGVTLEGGPTLPAGLVVFSAGIRPRDELAGPAGLERGERGGFLVDDHCRTADPRVWAVGECAAVEGRCYGLAAPGYRMAEAVAAQLLAESGDGASGDGDGSGAGAEPAAEPGTETSGRFPGADLSTRLKLLGVDVASFGDAHATAEGAMEFVHTDSAAGTYAKLVLGEDGRTLLGGVLAGDASAYGLLRTCVGRKLPASPEELLAAGRAAQD